MGKYRRAARVDNNQKEIVRNLRALGVSVDVGHDDIFCGWKGKNYWYELKDDEVIKKDGTFKKGAIKRSQEVLLKTWQGHYKIVSSLEEILADIGITYLEE